MHMLPTIHHCCVITAQDSYESRGRHIMGNDAIV